MTHPYVVVDAFTDTPLRGNPVAVFPDAAGLASSVMQEIGRELNLSETTFVLPAESDGDYRVRIFTPVNELPFAGHPLLGTAIALGELHGATAMRLETWRGTVPFLLERNGTSAQMAQPIPTWARFDEDAALLGALGVDGSDLPIEVYDNGPRHVFVALPDVDAVSALRPDHRALGQFPDLAVHCFAGGGRVWRNRMFSPAYGVVEDAATGSAAGPLAIHLVRHGRARADEWIDIHQGVEMGRHALMQARARFDGELVSRVHVRGEGVVVATGSLRL